MGMIFMGCAKRKRLSRKLWAGLKTLIMIGSASRAVNETGIEVEESMEQMTASAARRPGGGFGGSR